MPTTKQREAASRRTRQPKAPGDPTPGALSPAVGQDDQDTEAAERLAAAEAAQDSAESGDQPGGDQPEVPGGEPRGEALTDDERAQLAEHTATLTGGQAEPGADGEPEGDPKAEGEQDDKPAEPTPAERRKAEAAARKAAKEAEAAQRKAEREADAAARKVPGLCVHGCGERVQRPQAKFVRGHDSLLAKDLRAAYADGDMTAGQVREHATLISAKFLGKMERSIAAVDAERAATSEATDLRRSLIEKSLATAKGEVPAEQGGQDENKTQGAAA